MIDMNIFEDEIKEKDKTIQLLKGNCELNVKLQKGIYLKALKKMEPIINYIKGKGYYFKHPELNERTTRGPILGKNNKDNVLYVFSVEDNWVEGINMYDTRSKHSHMLLEDYLERHDFETAMKGIMNLVHYQDDIINDLESFKRKSESLIEKYESI